MYGEINMAPEAPATSVHQARWAKAREIAAAVIPTFRRTYLSGTEDAKPAVRIAHRALVEAGWSPFASPPELSPFGISELNRLRDFRDHVAERLDRAGVEGPSEQLLDRLDLALAGYSKPVDPDLLAARRLAYDAMVDFARQAKYPNNARSRFQRAEATLRGELDSSPLVVDMLRAYKAGKAAAK